MARLSFLLVFALSVIPAIVTAGLTGQPFHVRGRVYCDTCNCGFETKKTTYIEGAKVRIECVDRITLRLKFSLEGETDSTGTYNMVVEDDHKDEICTVTLVASPLSDCHKPNRGRDRATVILTRFNGAISNLHFANAMGFSKDEPLPGCTELVKSLLESDI